MHGTCARSLTRRAGVTEARRRGHDDRARPRRVRAAAAAAAGVARHGGDARHPGPAHRGDGRGALADRSSGRASCRSRCWPSSAGAGSPSCGPTTAGPRWAGSPTWSASRCSASASRSPATRSRSCARPATSSGSPSGSRSPSRSSPELLIDSPIPFLGHPGQPRPARPDPGGHGQPQPVRPGLPASRSSRSRSSSSPARSAAGWASPRSCSAACARLCRDRRSSPRVLLVVAVAALALWLVRRSPAPRRTPLQIGLLVGGLVARRRRLVRARADHRVLQREQRARVPVGPLGPALGAHQPRPHPRHRLDRALAHRDCRRSGSWDGPASATRRSAFNAYLDVWFQVGLIGIFVFCVLVLLTFTRSWLLAGRKRSVVLAWAPLVVLALGVTGARRELRSWSSGDGCCFVICTVKAAQELSWRTAWRPPLVEDTGP